ncbi:hypothetical protein PsorP6_002177 [Peronosclerospora sorghi]|uniref:Uncharacterized protein n=1 Tax=Peronosclerospora sorghi TaxID=230839 RepID=A0ACC0WVY1_9STRA|nr:hypothetical protein PsorP6_002177 [Peronosclerospora sorghi]
MESPPPKPSSDQARPMDISPGDASTIAADNQRMLPPPVNNLQDNNDTRLHDRALVLTDQKGDNCIVFGGQYAPRNIDRASIGLLPPPPSENSVVPWSNDTIWNGDGVEDNDDSEEPDPKRLLLTEGYYIALEVMDFPRTYNEAMASPQAYKWERGNLS